MAKDKETLEGKKQPPEEEEEESVNQPPEPYRETLEKLQKEKDDQYDLLLRKQAELENYRKRVEKEKQDLRFAVQAEVMERLLPILDAFQKGLSSLKEAPEDSELQTYREGYDLMHKEIQSVLQKFGVTEVPGVGTQFDPNVHEAVVREVTTEHEEGEILTEYRKGYKIKDRLLRPSQVRVAVQPDDLSAAQRTREGGEK
ncbi:MAG: nucleotide exchange factor GrpE [Acidobacteria bacterium]|nr:nucleotide exchange factor GrpE [Acidobacteriota bacterium]